MYLINKKKVVMLTSVWMEINCSSLMALITDILSCLEYLNRGISQERIFPFKGPVSAQDQEI
jgi:hypothetical protein